MSFDDAFARRAFPIALAVVVAVGVLGIVRARAQAALAGGALAPPFTADAAQGGKTFRFDLAQALARGPVVLYFYPKSFTSGCTIEAHDFSEHVGDYAKYGATVVGISGDSLATQRKFSEEECRSKFAVLADPGLRIAKAYKARLGFGPIAFADRTSYVIGRDGKILYAYTSMNPAEHVKNTLAAVAKAASH